MNEQNGAPSLTKQPRSRKSTITNQENKKQVLAAPRPLNDSREAWKTYWRQQGQPWRTEPEIDVKRQGFLTEQRNTIPNIEQGIYPFKNIKLSRADVEWLLAIHENGRGPVDWNDESQRLREGLDLRGANLSEVDLSYLPLARLRGGLGLYLDEWLLATKEQREMAALLLKGANLRGSHLEGAHLRFAHLEGANLRFAFLERTHLRGAYLIRSDLCEAYLAKARLENAILEDEHHVGPRVVDAKWEEVNLAVVKWSQVEMLGDEYEARQKRYDGQVKGGDVRLKEYEIAVRANRQLAVAQQSQGLNEDASYFSYRAQKLQRVVLWRQRKFGSFLFSGFLDLLAGYGYRPGRSVVWYLIIIFGFALAYFAFGHIPPLEAFIFSLTSFHGRGFFPGNNIPLSDPRVVLASFEAVVGLLIEISFIATFTQRFFGR